ncbi:hypothetical protein TspCOW1_18980 [Thiohalobacter sp. COW1]|uniref:O-linked N-acetylglucosamine transferase, SPINDLY family protein n=1 Tax=Thiohalobacter sp. COW1 TaxID=2795687 RepID=UPI001915AB1B|nr:tetratricopeptide repeat protein [Thiohalobacter sp. COW1]BCO31795.1 hypothetical protein TspCOW1_18980 [Thiohalobacter sp. COW1]
MAKKDILFRSRLKKARSLLESGQLEAAESALSRLVHAYPRNAELWLLRGVLEGKRRNPVAAADHLSKAAELQPENSAIQYNYGIALRDSGNYEHAITTFNRAVELNPGHDEAWDCLAHAYIASGDLDRAIDTFKIIIQRAPYKAEAQSNLGSVYQAQGRLSEAEECYRQALSCKPDLEIADNLGSVLVSQGRFEEALDVYRNGFQRQTGKRKVLSNLLLTLNYLPGLDQAEVLEEHKQLNPLFSRMHRYSNELDVSDASDRIRVGYISPDLREHSVAYFIEPLLERHDRDRFEVWVYSVTARTDATTQRLRSLAEHWVDVSALTFEQTAEIIHQNKTDILVDLAGHTACNSLPVLACKPAPVQLTWLGYPNTTGLEEIDYRLVDALTDPPGQEDYYTEQLIRMPGCFLCYRPPEDAPAPSPLPATGNQGVTFGSFNNLAKINDGVIALWAQLLERVPDSRLLIKNPSLTDENTRIRYMNRFKDAGADEARITLMGHTPTRQQHLELYGQVDIALDTFPYNGTTTTCEALWMGVPVITLAGDRHAARVGASLLQALGHPEWVTDTHDLYIEAAADLVSDLTRLGSIRESLRDEMAASPLCDAGGFAGKVEKVYLDIRRHGSG